MGHTLPAGYTPAGPEVDQHIFPFQGGKGEAAAVEFLRREIRSQAAGRACSQLRYFFGDLFPGATLLYYGAETVIEKLQRIQGQVVHMETKHKSCHIGLRVCGET